jgi:hypothetical protein
MSEINDFKDLKIWQKGIDIAEKCYFLTKLFPKDEVVWNGTTNQKVCGIYSS